MNKEILSKIIIFASGLAVGALGSYKYLENKFRKLADEEIASVQEYAKRQIQKTDKKAKDDILEFKNQMSLFNENGEIEPYYDVQGIVDTDMLKENQEDYILEEPFIITMEQFNDEMFHFDKVKLTFYERDGVFTNDQDEIMDNINYLIGDAHHYFGYLPEYPDFLYVRNYRVATDFELQRVDASFSENIIAPYGYGELKDEEEYEKDDYILEDDEEE